jgi:hypothetical protein
MKELAADMKATGKNRKRKYTPWCEQDFPALLDAQAAQTTAQTSEEKQK